MNSIFARNDARILADSPATLASTVPSDRPSERPPAGPTDGPSDRPGAGGVTAGRVLDTVSPSFLTGPDDAPVFIPHSRCPDDAALSVGLSRCPDDGIVPAPMGRCPDDGVVPAPMGHSWGRPAGQPAEAPPAPALDPAVEQSLLEAIQQAHLARAQLARSNADLASLWSRFDQPGLDLGGLDRAKRAEETARRHHTARPRPVLTQAQDLAVSDLSNLVG